MMEVVTSLANAVPVDLSKSTGPASRFTMAGLVQVSNLPNVVSNVPNFPSLPQVGGVFLHAA